MTVLDTAEDWTWWINTWQFVLDSARLTTSDRVVMAFSFGPFIGFWSAFESVAARGALCIPSGGLTTLDWILAEEQFGHTSDILVRRAFGNIYEILLEGTDSQRRDFTAFVKACERHGRGDIPSIAAEIEGKDEKEVKAYSKVFWANATTLNDFDRIIKNIERGEQKIQRQQHIVNTLAAKLGQYRNPWRELRLHYGQNRGRAYTEEEDRFLLCKMHQLGYGAWEELKAEVRKSWLFRFDWFLKSRTPQELGRRCDTLIRIVEKELEGDDDDRAGGKRKAESSAGAGAKRGRKAA